MSVPSPRTASRSPSQSRPGTAGGSPWVPPGVRPHTTPNPHTTPLTGTRRNRAVERTHIFLDSKEMSPRDPSNYFWLYAAYDYRMQTPHEEARSICFRTIDRLIDKIRHLYHEAPSNVLTNSNATANSPPHATADAAAGGLSVPPPRGGRSASITSSSHASSAVGSVGSGEPKAHLIIDIISTKKHVGVVPEEGLPYRLGHDIYRYVDVTHGSIIATTFVGLTDNTARRVGRDVYYTKSDDLSRTHYGFHTVDREHLHIVFPPTELESGKRQSGSSASDDGEGGDTADAAGRSRRLTAPTTAAQIPAEGSDASPSRRQRALNSPPTRNKPHFA